MRVNKADVKYGLLRVSRREFHRKGTEFAEFDKLTRTQFFTAAHPELIRRTRLRGAISAYTRKPKDARDRRFTFRDATLETTGPHLPKRL